MRAKLIYCLLLAIVLSVVGCSSQRSHWPSTVDAHRTGQPALSGQLRGYNEAESDFNQGLALVADLRYSQARAKLLPLIDALDAAGDQNQAAEATFWVGYCYEKQGRKDEAVDFYNRVLRAYPQTSASHQANERLSRLTIRPGP